MWIRPKMLQPDPKRENLPELATIAAPNYRGGYYFRTPVIWGLEKAISAIAAYQPWVTSAAPYSPGCGSWGQRSGSGARNTASRHRRTCIYQTRSSLCSRMKPPCLCKTDRIKVRGERRVSAAPGPQLEHVQAASAAATGAIANPERYTWD